ncbi:hypothetical protein GGX14DRAFT_366857 [Mycena pura]|uniref:Uncharacterized protein n=1 Tax=Mycena pura TaxID=153505 RepID=A0AAD6Y7W0_9AGAR|nr:hypothetical protein GGX14DRAFT_377189 [Mycena pura]KAJ7206886.1 hypothetical protein GGX14DRAFT_366857 [Mycena pura]
MLKDDAADRYSDTETEDATASDDSDAEPTPVPRRRTTRKAGPIQRARKTVAFVRKSGQRRDELLDIVERGNETHTWWEIEAGSGVRVTILLKKVVLLPSVKTRWDSDFYMLRRLRYLRQPLQHFFLTNRDARDFKHKLTDEHWDRLELMELILEQPHVVQSVMAAENTPMLAAAIPAFELFVNSWEAMKADNELELQNVTQFIEPGLAIAEKYYNKFEDTDAYLISMCMLFIHQH